MEYVAVAQLKARERTGLSDEVLEELIAEASALISARLGVEPAATVVERFVEPGQGLPLTYVPDLSQPFEVKDLERNEVVSSDAYLVSGRLVLRQEIAPNFFTSPDMSTGPYRPGWPRQVQVTYAVRDRERVLTLLQGICIDLCRIAMREKPATRSERIGDYAYDQGEAGVERQRVLNRLNLIVPPRPVMA